MHPFNVLWNIWHLICKVIDLAVSNTWILLIYSTSSCSGRGSQHTSDLPYHDKLHACYLYNNTGRPLHTYIYSRLVFITMYYFTTYYHTTYKDSTLLIKIPISMIPVLSPWQNISWFIYCLCVDNADDTTEQCGK